MPSWRCAGALLGLVRGAGRVGACLSVAALVSLAILSVVALVSLPALSAAALV
jgi:hypothetical protein